LVQEEEATVDINNDPFAPYFMSLHDPTLPPKVLVTTSPKATKTTYEFCHELVGVFPGAEFIQRKRFELGRIAGWASHRGYKNMIVVNEDKKKPSEKSILYTPEIIADHRSRRYDFHPPS